MSHYDGPSYYKKNHPKIRPLKEGETKNRRERATHFQPADEKSVSDQVPQRGNLRKKELGSLSAPLRPTARANRRSNKGQTLNSQTDTRNTERFRRTYIPASLQHLEGWQSSEKNYRLLSELEKRLAKETDSYLLFADHLAKDPQKALSAEKKEQPTQNAKKKSRAASRKIEP